MLGGLPGSADPSKVRSEVNAFIRTSPVFNGGVLDIAKVLGQPDDDNVPRAGVDSGDGIHPNTAGYAAIAKAFTALMAKGCR